MNCPACSKPLDGRKVKLTQDGPTVNHWAGTCACGEEITATVRTRPKPVEAVKPPHVVGARFGRMSGVMVKR